MENKATIYIASKPPRGSGTKWPVRPNVTRIDVTSANVKYRNDLSPLFVGPTTSPDGIEFQRFENAWQYSKVYPQLGHFKDGKETNIWEMWREKGTTKLKNGKGIRTDPKISKLKKHWRETGEKWTPIHARWGDERLTYIDARKKIYIPEYLKLIQNTATIRDLKTRYAKGESFMFIDLDGPPTKHFPKGMKVTVDALETMLNNPDDLFGHGYVVAAVVCGLEQVLLDMCQLYKKRKL